MRSPTTCMTAKSSPSKNAGDSDPQCSTPIKVPVAINGPPCLHAREQLDTAGRNLMIRTPSRPVTHAFSDWLVSTPCSTTGLDGSPGGARLPGDGRRDAARADSEQTGTLPDRSGRARCRRRVKTDPLSGRPDARGQDSAAVDKPLVLVAWHSGTERSDTGRFGHDDGPRTV